MNTLCVHITFFYVFEKLENLKKIIDKIIEYNYFKKIDIFIHTNQPFEHIPGTKQIVHNCNTFIHPHHLAWAHRSLLKSQINDYKYFMYMEDDILIKSESIDYWLEYNHIMKKNKFALGFTRIEVDSEGVEYVTDLLEGEKNDEIIILDKNKYVCQKRNYKGFWIYDKKDMEIFANQPDFDKFPNYIENAREYSAWGMDGPNTKALIPIGKKNMDIRNKVFHLSNNYVNNPNTKHAKVRYIDCI